MIPESRCRAGPTGPERIGCSAQTAGSRVRRRRRAQWPRALRPAASGDRFRRSSWPAWSEFVDRSQARGVARGVYKDWRAAQCGSGQSRQGRASEGTRLGAARTCRFAVMMCGVAARSAARPRRVRRPACAHRRHCHAGHRRRTAMAASRLRRRGRCRARQQGQDSQKGEQNAHRLDHHRSSRGPASAPIAQGINMPSEYQIATKGAPASGQ
jgi:hypothetical protein